MSTNFPTNPDTYTTKVDGVDTVMAAHINDLQDAMMAVQDFALDLGSYYQQRLDVIHSLELGYNRTSDGFAYIDLHTKTDKKDYDARILASGGTSSIGGATLTYYAASHNFDGQIKDESGNNYGRPVFLTTPLTSTSWDGDTKTSADRAIVDLSAVFGVPDGVKAVLMTIQTQADAVDEYIRFGPNSTYNYALTCRTTVAGQIAHATGVVPCDSNGDVYCYPSGTVEGVWVWIWGYWL